jgi:hypothetical protein
MANNSVKVRRRKKRGFPKLLTFVVSGVILLALLSGPLQGLLGEHIGYYIRSAFTALSLILLVVLMAVLAAAILALLVYQLFFNQPRHRGR